MSTHGRQIKNVAGQRFLRLTVLKMVGHSSWLKQRRVLWLCRCDCGNLKTMVAGNLGRIHSCGCIRKEQNIIHGMHRTPTHRSWSNMIGRCHNPNDTAYARYGGRGIKVCPQWRNFEQFFKDMGECPTGLTIDRINNDGNYEPGNCRWASRQTQSENRAYVTWIEFNGVRKNRAQWGREIGIESSTLKHRIDSGWPLERALTQPPNPNMQWKRGRKTVA